MHSLIYNPESFLKTPTEFMPFRGQDDTRCRLAGIKFLAKKERLGILGGKEHIPVFYARWPRYPADLSGKG